MAGNVYFELTKAFNETGRIAFLALALPGGHGRLLALAAELLPTAVSREAAGDEAAQ